MFNPLPDYTIARAVLGDVAEMDRIEQEAFSTPWSHDLIRAAVLNDGYRVRSLRSEREGLLGFYIAHTVRGRSNLDNLAVERTARNYGYGSELLRDWIGHGRSDALDALTLQVNTANLRAQQLYERFHFRTAKLLVAYYPNGDDAYQMEFLLAPARERETAPGSRRYWLRPRKRGWLSVR